MAENIAVLNLSKTRKFVLPSLDGKKAVELLPEKSIEITAKDAELLLGKLANGRARYPDLCDASKISPLSAKAKDALEENKKLLAENAALKAQLEAQLKAPAKEDGGKKK